MEFKEFSTAIFSIIDMEPVEVTKETDFKDELEVDSLQFVNLVIGAAEKFNVPFETFIQNTDKIQTVGGLYEVIIGRQNQ